MTDPKSSSTEVSNSSNHSPTNNEASQKKGEREQKKREDDKNKHYDRFTQEQDEIWEKLREKLENFTKSLGATQQEIADGLVISRKVANQFLKDRRHKSLPISRANIKALWAYLTDSDRIKGKKLSEAQKKEREKLKKEGCGELLKVAGFAPDPKDENLGNIVPPDRQNKIYRIISRLSSSWVRNDDILQIEEIILDNILKERSEKQDAPISIDTELKKLENWITQNYPDSDLIVRKKFISVIKGYAMSGKVSFDEAELFELYQCIKENLCLRQDIKSSDFNLRVMGCEFRIISCFLDEFNDDPLWKSIKKKGLEKEKYIRQIYQSDSSDELLKNEFVTPVKEAEITFRMTLTKASPILLVWRYSSVSNHIENMLTALDQGMGYPPLKIYNLSIVALGKTANSLARVSVGLVDKNTQQKYQGLWVDKDTLNCLLQSVVIAVEGWLIETEKYKQNYSQMCQKLNRVLNNLYQARKRMNDYHLQDIKDNNGVVKVKGANTYLDEVLTTINEIEQNSNYEDEKDQVIQKEFLKRLQRHKHMAKLMLSRSFHIEGKLQKVKQILYGNNSDNYKNGENFSESDIAVFYVIEDIIYKFFSGKPDFVNDKSWRDSNDDKNLRQYQDRIKTYISGNVNNEIIFDFDLHLCLSELFGNFGRLELYFCRESDAEAYLREAIDRFLIAAYFSCKIGNKQRVSHWLAHVSRAYSRLGDAVQADKYADQADKIIEQEASDYRYTQEHKESIRAEVNLAKGENHILKKEFGKALSCFQKSLKGAIELRFARLIADSIYGIYRSYKPQQLSEEDIKKINDFPSFYQKQSHQEHTEITQEVIAFLSNEKIYENSNLIPQEFKKQAIKIWQNWANVAAREDGINEYEHPIAIAIERDEFLSQKENKEKVI
ncbi:MAG: hypothetical protein RLZZ338_4847 [Cyanobacteriota bacterium]|jgi:hypothetical protein